VTKIVRAITAGLLVLAVLALAPMAAEATEAPLAPTWVNVDTSTWSNLSSAAVAPNGDVIAGGWFTGQSTFGTGPSAVTLTSAGSFEAVITRTRPDGTLVWARAAGGLYADQTDGLAIDPAGGFFVWGHYGGTITLRGSTPPLVLAGGDTYNNGDGFVAHYDDAGVPQWARHMGGPYIDGYNAGTVDPSGNLVLGALATVGASGPGPSIDTGTGTQTVGGNFLVRYDSTGNLLTISPPVSGDSPMQVLRIRHDGVLMRGARVFVGGVTSVVVETLDAASLAITSTHTIATGSGDSTLFDVAFDANDNLLAVGYVSTGSNVVGGPPVNGYRGFLVSYSPTWNLNWFDNPEANLTDVVADSNRIYVAGHLESNSFPAPPFSSTFGGPDGITLRTDDPDTPGTGIALAEYEPDGSIHSAQAIRVGGFGYPGQLAVSGTSLYVTGLLAKSSTFGLGAGAIVTPVPAPGTHYQGFVARFDGRSPSQLVDLRSHFTVSSPVVAVGTNATVTARVLNAGPDTATNTTATVTLGPGLSLVSASPDTGTVTGNVWTIGTLPRDVEATMTLILSGSSAASSGGTVAIAAASDGIEISRGEESRSSWLGIDFDGSASSDLGWVHRATAQYAPRANRAAPTPDGGAVMATVGAPFVDEGVGADARRVFPLPGSSSLVAIEQNDATGAVQWTRAISFEHSYAPGESTPAEIGVDGAGTVFVAGVLRTTTRFDHGDGTTTMLAPPNNSFSTPPVYLASWAADGSFRFAEIAITSATPNDHIGLKVAPDGTVYLGVTLFQSGVARFGTGAGAIAPPPPSMGSAAAIGAFDTNGQAIWAQVLRGQPGDLSAFRSFDVDSAGLTVAGVLISDPGGPAQTNDVVVTTLSPSGAAGPVTHLFPSRNFTTAPALARGPNGLVAIVGSYSGTLTIAGLPALPDTAGQGSNGYAVVLDAANAPMWSAVLAGAGKEHLDAVDFDSSGHLVVGGGSPASSTLAATPATDTAGGGIVAVLADDHTVLRHHQVTAANGIDSLGIEPNGDLLVAGVHGPGASVGTPPSELRLPGAFAATFTASSAPPGTLAGTVVDEAYTPLAGVTITVMAAWPSWTVVATATSDGAGHFAFDLPAGDYRVRAYDAAGRVDRTWFPAASNYHDASTVRVLSTLVTNANIGAPSRTGGTLHGTVTDATATPLSGIWVQVFDATGYVAGATTDGSGAYRVAGLRAASYWVRFVDLTHVHASRWWQSSPTKAGANPVVVAFPTGAIADITLP